VVTVNVRDGERFQSKRNTGCPSAFPLRLSPWRRRPASFLRHSREIFVISAKARIQAFFKVAGCADFTNEVQHLLWGVLRWNANIGTSAWRSGARLPAVALPGNRARFRGRDEKGRWWQRRCQARRSRTVPARPRRSEIGTLGVRAVPTPCSFFRHPREPVVVWFFSSPPRPLLKRTACKRSLGRGSRLLFKVAGFPPERA
jgi:hypothetical protein